MSKRRLLWSSTSTLLVVAACGGSHGDTSTADSSTDTSIDAPSCTPGTVDDTDPGLSGQHVVIDVTMQRFGIGPVAMGANINKWYGHAQGLWNPQHAAPVAEAVTKTATAHLGILRYPGGTSANL